MKMNIGHPCGLDVDMFCETQKTTCRVIESNIQ